jgi:hypothetical protein
MFEYVDTNSSLDKGRNCVLQLTLCRTFDSTQQHNNITTFTHGERQALMLAIHKFVLVKVFYM